MNHCKTLFVRRILPRLRPHPFSAAGPTMKGYQRCLSSSPGTIVDLRSDTVTQPTRPMLETALMAPTGDDVMGEDPTVIKLQEYMADLCGKEKGLYVPTGTMSNLVAALAHCHGRASEILVGSGSHINLWEGGNISNLGGISKREIRENPHDATMDPDDISDCHFLDNDDHYARTELLCLENTHNSLGGIALPPSYISDMGTLCQRLGIKLHVDGARLFHAAVSLKVSLRELCDPVDSVSLCLSKGLGAPLGSVLVGDAETIRLAKRARKRCGGGMRQAGVVAAMGLYGVQNHVKRLEEDHRRAQYLATELKQHGFEVPRLPDTNLVFFGLPPHSSVTRDEFTEILGSDYNVKLYGGYSRGGKLFRAVTHMDVDDNGIERAVQAMIRVALG